MLAEQFARVAVVGTGMMGPGIALTLARGGCRVALYGRTEASKDRGLARVDGALAFLVEHGVLEAWEAPALQRALAPALCNSPEPLPLLDDMIRRGELGVKAGRGFYDWAERDAGAVKERRDAFLCALARGWDEGRETRAVTPSGA